MKKVLSLVLALTMVFAFTLTFTGCGGSDSEEGSGDAAFKAGFICLHDENSTYDKNFIDAANAACEELGVEAIIKTNVPEGQECYDAAAELVDSGCGIIFADSFGHEDYMIQAAKEFPEVQFCHSTGTKAHTEGLDNYHNAFASIYQGRYLAGIAAGMKLNEMIEKGDITADQAKIGYVGAFTYAEVVSGYTSFFLGARSVCESATMDVTFTGSWYDETLEKEGATKLIDGGCVLLSQHADSMGAPTACENAGVPDWVPYYEYAIQAAQNGEAIDADWTGDLETGSVQLTEINENVAAEGTAEAIEEAKAKLIDGSLQVFDTSTFTVDGKAVTEYDADVDTDPEFKGDTNVIEDGAFKESKFRSAPYFDLQIDGIELLDTKF